MSVVIWYEHVSRVPSTTHVPVGEDQRQHLELARELAQKMNRVTKADFFPLPTAVISGWISPCLIQLTNLRPCEANTRAQRQPGKEDVKVGTR